MFSGFDARWLDYLKEQIDLLERRALEGTQPDEFAVEDVLDGCTFLSIEGLADIWDGAPGVNFAQCITDILVGAHSQQKMDVTFVLAGNEQKIAVYISLGDPAMSRSLLTGILPGIHLNSSTVTNLAARLKPHFQVKGIMSGIPSPKGSTLEPPASNRNPEQSFPGMSAPNASGAQSMSRLERVVRGLHGATWAYIVQAHPRPRNKVAEKRLEVIDMLAQVASQTRRQLQATTQGSKQATAVDTSSTTETLSGEVVNYRAQYLMKLLERELERLEQAGAMGQWLIQSYFGASTPAEAQRLASLLSGTLGGKDSRPDPLRAYLCSRYGRYLSEYSTMLSSEELATMVQFPREEVPGYAISDFVRFDVDFRSFPVTTRSSATLELGSIQHNNEDTGPYGINLDDLAKHGVVVGVTGSGKTTTVMNILDRLVLAKKPFLIIEPAKTEYRALRPAWASRVNVRIYTLGNEIVAPFRLNPFEFETDEREGSAPIANHIDFLKAVFNAAFILYAPMPYVLETALHEVYEDKGWDLATGLNSRLPRWSERHLYPIFPTLTDLYRKVEQVVDRLGYETRLEQDIKAGLQARIGSMRIGSKGLMLDTARGISMQQLFAEPTILEMENIGGDEEKTFLMGLLLAKLYEYRRLQAASATLPGGLQHLIVFEEAHRLLRNTETQVSTEGANPRAQAIEVFTNMLSEVRAYGQGVLVAEQIPSKLAPDVLKNTNLKIAHRLIAQDDRESVGRTMNLNAEQINHLGVLTPGMTALYAEGADHAYKVRMENYKRTLTPLNDDSLKADSPKYASVTAFLAILDIHRYGIQRSAFGSPDAAIYQAAGKLLETSHGRGLWGQIFLRTVYNRSKLPEMFPELRRQIESELSYLSQNQKEVALRMLIVRGCTEIIQNHGFVFGWSYPAIDELRVHLTRGLIAFVQTKDLNVCNSELDRFMRKYEKLLQRDQGPFPGCIHCRAICLYRLETRQLLLRADKRWFETDLKSSAYKTKKDRYASMSRLAKGIAEQWLGSPNDAAADIGYCAALHAFASVGLTDFEQSRTAKYLSDELLR